MDLLNQAEAVVYDARVDLEFGGELVVGLHGAVERCAGFAVGDDGDGARGHVLPDFFEGRESGAIKSHVDQSEGDGTVELILLDVGFDADSALTVIAAKGVLQPLDAIAAEAP